MTKRFLGLHELLACNLSQYLPHNIVSYIELEGQYDIDKLVSTIQAYSSTLTQFHYYLNESHLFFEEAQNVTFPIEITSSSKDILPENIINIELNKKFDLYSPPLVRFKLVVLHNKIYIFSTFHHSIIDGLPARYVLFKILDAYHNDLIFNSSVKINSTKLDRVENYLNFGEYIYKKLPYNGTLNENSATRVIIGDINAIELNRIIEWCKKNKIRFTSYLAIVANRTLSKIVGLENMQLGMLFNLRPFMNIKVRDDEVYFASGASFFELESINKKSSIELFGKLSEQIDSVVFNKTVQEELKLLSDFNARCLSIDSLISNIRYNKPSVFISNLGRFKPGNLKINDRIVNTLVTATTHFYSADPNRFFLVSSIFNDKLTLTLHYNYPLTSIIQAREVLSNIKRDLEHCIDRP